MQSPVFRAGLSGADTHGRLACHARAIPAPVLHSWRVGRSRRTALLRRLGHRPQAFAGIVSLHASGHWSFSPDEAGLFRLVRVWDAGFWVTLRLRREQAAADGRRHDVSIWKCCLAEPDWRNLRVQLARQAAMPGRTLNKESA